MSDSSQRQTSSGGDELREMMLQLKQISSMMQVTMERVANLEDENQRLKDERVTTSRAAPQPATVAPQLPLIIQTTELDRNLDNLQE